VIEEIPVSEKNISEPEIQENNGYNRAVVDIKKIIDSFLELVINKKAKSLHVDSSGFLSILTFDNKLEKEKNENFNFKDLSAFANYVMPGSERNIFEVNNFFKTKYSFSSREFNVVISKCLNQINFSFVLVNKIADLFLPVINSIDYTRAINKNRGSINILSGFEDEYADEYAKMIVDKIGQDFKNFTLVFEREKVEFASRNLIIDYIKTPKNGVLKNILGSLPSIIFYKGGIDNELLDDIIDGAWSGKNIFILTKGKNAVGEIIEFYLSLIENDMKKRLFVKFINTVTSLNLLPVHNGEFIPVWEFAFFDKKLKRSLLEEKYDNFFRDLSETNNENIISFSKILNKSVTAGKISRTIADNFLRDFSAISE
ncbi:MAG: hypothetical protein WC002_04945, partial [Candidatus Muiribacteriota bacterium]